jgi:predicted transcriptional regulator of viral defense system
MEPIQNGTHSIRFLKTLSERGLSIFTAADANQIAENISIPSKYVTNLLMIMVRDGWLIRLHRGLYARSNSITGESNTNSFSIATNLVTPSAISHWSALHYHGLTEQIPRTVTAFTFKKVVTPSMRSKQKNNDQARHAWIINGIRYEYITVKEKHYFGIEDVWVDELSRIPITDKERTVLETFVSTKMFRGISEAMGIIENHLHEINIEKLVKYAFRYGKISIAKRIGWILEQAGADSLLLEPLQEIPAIGYHLLDPTLPAKGSCDSRWMIQNNVVKKATH